jgi:hypothetical protein
MLSLRMSKAASGLPISVAQLASNRNMRRPISLRALVEAAGTRSRQPRVCVLRYEWQTPKPGVDPMAIWPDTFLDEVLRVPNGWSVKDYWSRCTNSLIDFQFTVEPWRILKQDQSAKDSGDRNKVIQMSKDQAAADGVSLAGFDHVIAFLHPPNNPAGAAGGDAVFDQAPYSLEFYEHEIGHVLGYSHAFGTNGDYAYQDSWCVMGFSRWQERSIPIPPAFAGVPIIGPADFWHCGRRLATAALFRYDGATDFSTTSGVIHMDGTGGPRTVDLVAASESQLYDPTIVVVSSDNFQVAVEYRTNTNDDEGIRHDQTNRSAIIVHSIGRRSVLGWQSEQNPIWMEAEIPAEANQEAWIDHGWNSAPGKIHVQVVAVSGPRATVRVGREDPS